MNQMKILFSLGGKSGYWTLVDVLYEKRKKIPPEIVKAEGDEARNEFMNSDVTKMMN